MLYLALVNGREVVTVLSREGVTHGDLLAIVVYGILIIPSIQILKREFPDIFQPWYADDGTSMAPISRLRQFFDRLTVIGPPYGYNPERPKLILIVPPNGNERETQPTASHSFKVTNGSQYLSGFIGEKKLTQNGST
mmetsp:Transcript_44530/g.53447  ORF Transcript_44530/g.53447 Transcript_44530/m.53447 type:complete len:137 (-) Transcript_44530:327-737(-)